MKSKSYLFLFVLALILVFILGVRYGQKVEKANKVINYLLNVTPTSLPFPKYATPSPSLKVKEDPTKSAVIFKP